VAGLGFGRSIGHTLRVPGRGVRRVAVIAVVLMLAGALGGAVAVTAPYLLAKIRPAAVAADLPPAPRPALVALPAGAPAPTAAGLTAVLGPLAAAMPGRFTGTVVDPATAQVLWQEAADQPLAPGSTGKLLTTAGALLTLNPTGTLVTRAAAGPEAGTVVLVGGGDPTLTALPDGKTGVYPDPARLTSLAAAVKAAMPGGVTKVLIDTSRYTGPTMASGWDPADIPAGNIAPIQSLMLDGGRVDPTKQDGARVEKPALAAGQAFAGLLGADPSAVTEITSNPNATVLGAVASAPISDLVEHLIQTSDNVSAEVLARETAIARSGDPSFTGAVTQVMAALSQAGIDPAGAVMSDGSGLSTDDRIPAKLLGAVLAAAAAPSQGPQDTEFLRPIVSGLPVAGGDGTLDDRFAPTADSAAGRGVVRAKTGTLTGVSSLAGVVTDRDGRLLVFALMSNGPSPSAIRPRLDDIAATLSGCGCR
jgi:serine-type D-Ala-D-Ala carboxypeptidase/endopeptidase (penicillin-binding protein 4)